MQQEKLRNGLIEMSVKRQQKIIFETMHFFKVTFNFSGVRSIDEG